MTHLKLSNPTTHSCNYEIYLSNSFNQTYYKKIRITGDKKYKDKKSYDDIDSYVVSKNAPSRGKSHYVYGVINNGMSAGKKYTLYAFAQAQNGIWYKAGTYSIVTLSKKYIKISGVFNSFNQRNPKYVPSLEGRCYECALACAVSFELQQEVSPNDLANTATYSVKVINKSDPVKMVNEMIASIDEGRPILAHYYETNSKQHWVLVYGYNTDIFTDIDFSDKYETFDTYNYFYVKDSVTEGKDINDSYGYDNTLAKAMALSINYSQSKKYLSKTINECRYVTNVKLKK